MLHEAVLLCQNLLEPGEAGEGILLRQLRLALNERQSIVDEIMRDKVALGIDPLLWHLLLGVCDLGERQQLRLTGVATVDRAALEGDHLIGDARDGVLHRGASGHDSLLDVGLAGEVRGIELSLLQRCGAHLASETDIEEAVMAGRAAVENAVAGITDKMVAFERETVNGHYACKTKLLPLTSVANYEKKIPLEWINDAHNGVKQELIDYVLPLIQGEPKLPKEDSLPRFAKLKKVLAK